MSQLLLWKGNKIDTGERLMAALPFAFGTGVDVSVPIWETRKKLSRGRKWVEGSKSLIRWRLFLSKSWRISYGPTAILER